MESGSASAQEVRASLVESQKGVDQGIKEYLNPNERLAARMKASLEGSQTKGKDNGAV